MRAEAQRARHECAARRRYAAPVSPRRRYTDVVPNAVTTFRRADFATPTRSPAASYCRRCYQSRLLSDRMLAFTYMLPSVTFHLRVAAAQPACYASPREGHADGVGAATMLIALTELTRAAWCALFIHQKITSCLPGAPRSSVARRVSPFVAPLLPPQAKWR